MLYRLTSHGRREREARAARDLLLGNQLRVERDLGIACEEA
jgi:hypothetical protein